MFEGSGLQEDMFTRRNVDTILDPSSELDDNSTNGAPNGGTNLLTGLGSLGLDSKSRTPMSLIQQDFPSTPSAFYNLGRFEVPTDETQPTFGMNSPNRNKNNSVDGLTQALQQTSISQQLIPQNTTGVRGNPNGRQQMNGNANYPPNAQHNVQYIMPGQQYYMQQPPGPPGQQYYIIDQNGQPVYYRSEFPQDGAQFMPNMYMPPAQQGYYAPPGYMGMGQHVDATGRKYMYNYGQGPNMNGMRDNRQLQDNRYRRQNWDRVNKNNAATAAQNANAVNPMRDPVVDDFRATYGKSKQWDLADLVGHVLAFCQDQHGSRFIQQRLEICTDADKQIIYDEIVVAASSLMTDVFGNYVLQKLFEFGTPDHCEGLARMLENQCVQLSMHMYGCRVVQRALEYVGTDRLVALVSEFENPPILLRCVHDSNGNHVIQKCIEIISKRAADETIESDIAEFLNSRIHFIIDSFKGRIKELSSHPYGCRVSQRILEHCSNVHKTTVLEELRQYYSELVQDCYGNYVIQFVMQHGWEIDRAALIKEVQTNLLDFSQHKFASNVVEKCLEYANKRDRDEMIWTIINVTFDLNNPVDAKTGHCVLESMVRDPYANYVVQKVIDVSDERQRGAICRYVKENIIQLRRYTYGKHIIVRLEKLTNEKF